MDLFQRNEQGREERQPEVPRSRSRAMSSKFLARTSPPSGGRPAPSFPQGSGVTPLKRGEWRWR